jgi:hypothetical protein
VLNCFPTYHSYSDLDSDWWMTMWTDDNSYEQYISTNMISWREPLKNDKYVVIKIASNVDSMWDIFVGVLYNSPHDDY